MRIARKRNILIIAIVFLAVLCLGAGLFWYDSDVGFGAPRQPGFTAYKPTVLPPDVRITGEELARYKTRGLDYWTFDYTLSLNTPDLRIFERQKNAFEHAPISCQGRGDVCKLYTTQNGLTYRVLYGDFKGKAFSLTVEWLQGNTSFYMPISDRALPKYVDYDWSPMMNSMKPVDISHMRYKSAVQIQGGA